MMNANTLIHPRRTGPHPPLVPEAEVHRLAFGDVVFAIGAVACL